MQGYLYILKCSDNSYYTGSTINLERRILEHIAGKGSNYTKTRLPIKLVYHAKYQNIKLAFQREKQIQNWSVAKKEALINGDFEFLPDLSKKKF